MERLVYINGYMFPEHEAKISLFDVGRLYGACFYESIRTFRHIPFKLNEHLVRLERSLSYAGIMKPELMDRVHEAVEKTLEVNEGLFDPEDDFWFCVEVTPGVGFPMPVKENIYTHPTVVAYSSPLPYDEYARYYTEGKPVITSLFRNVPPQCFEQRCKNRSRLSHFLSKLSIQRVNPKAFALMLDINGFVSEGTGANIFFVIDKILYTPTVRNILAGISRQYVIELAKKLNLQVIETDITLYEAYNANEAFWTATSYCILPISSIDGRIIGEKYPGPITGKLIQIWSEEVGVDIVRQAQCFIKSGN
jgi:branched-chain amino acid aminotransferase